MFCTKCGFKNDDDAMFCAGCGSPMKKMEMPQQVEENVTPTTNDNDIQPVVQNIESSSDSEQGNDIQQSDFEQGDNIQQSDFEQGDYSRQSDFEQGDYSQQSDFGQGSYDKQIEFGPNMSQQTNYNQQPSMGFDNNYNPNNNMANTGKPKYKFSVKRFLFSGIAILASIFACICIFLFDFVDIKTSQDSEKDDVLKDKYTAMELIKGEPLDVDDIQDFTTFEGGLIKTVISLEKSINDDEVREEAEDEDELDIYEDLLESTQDVKKDVSLLRILTIVMTATLGLTALLSVILLPAVRKKGSYVIMLLLSIVNLGVTGFIFYIINFDIVDKCKKSFDVIIDAFGNNLSMTITSYVGLGLLLVLIMEAVTFISSIILCTCKRKFVD